MDKNQVNALFVAQVKKQVAKATALGIKASWRMSDQLDVAAEAMYAVSGITGENEEEKEKTLEQFRQACQLTYNHSAMAQKLEKEFKQWGHFQRSAKGNGEKTVDDVFANLAKELGAEKKEKSPEDVEADAAEKDAAEGAA